MTNVITNINLSERTLASTKRRLTIVKRKTTDTDSVLIEASIAGDQQAQYRLYHRYAQSMLNVAYRIVWNEEDARDVLQEAFLKIFTQLGQLKKQTTFPAWVKRIVVNTAINHYRKNGHLTFTELTDQDIADEGQSKVEETDWNIQLMKQCLQALPNGYRTVLSLYLIEGYDHKEIAGILGISTSTSITQYNRGKKRLRALINEQTEKQKNSNNRNYG